MTFQKKVGACPRALHNPFSGSAPGGERVVPSRGGEAAPLGAGITSPKHNSHPCANRPAPRPDMLCVALQSRHQGRRITQKSTRGGGSGP